MKANCFDSGLVDLIVRRHCSLLVQWIRGQEGMKEIIYMKKKEEENEEKREGEREKKEVLV